jgi:hypothetical protein
MTVGALAGKEYELSALAAAAATTINTNAVPKGAVADTIYVVIDPYTDECEVRKVTTISDTTLTVAALDYAHAANDAVFFISDAVLNAKWFGATGDGSTDDATSINRAIVQAYGLGNINNIFDFGSVFIPPGNYIIDASIVIYEFVRIFGVHPSASKLKLKNSADTDVMITRNFADLTGTGYRSYAPVDPQTKYIPCAFAIENLTINGNRANNSSGAGIKIYGHHYRIDNVRIYHTAEQGFYSEYGSGTGDQQGWYDMPQAYIGQLFIYRVDGKGFEFWGPHDSYFEHLTVNGAGDDGIHINEDANTGGINDLMFCHSYTCGTASNNTARGFYSKARIRASYIQSEGNRGSNFVVDTADRWSVAKLVTYGCGASVTSPAGRSPSHAYFYDDSGTSFTALTNAIDGDTGTNSAVTVEAAGPDYIYVGDDDEFNEVIMNFASVVNANASVLTAEYKASSWTSLTTREGTDNDGATFGRDGRITYTLPTDWELTSVNGVSKKWIRMSVSANLTASVEIAEIKIRDERYNVHIKSGANYGSIADLVIKDDNGVGGMRIDAHHINVAAALVDGKSTAGTGVIIDEDGCAFRGTIFDYTGTGAEGLITGESTTTNRGHIDVRISDCTTGWWHKRQSKHTIYDVSFYESTGYSAFTGKRPGDGDVWNVSGYEKDATNDRLYSERWTKDVGAVALDTTNLQTITFTHDAIMTPNIEECYASLIKSTDVSDFVVDFIWIKSVSATQISVEVKLGTASGTGGAVADLRVGYRI